MFKYLHTIAHAEKEKDFKRAEITTSKFVYGKVTYTNLVQRNSENLERKKQIKGNKKEKRWNVEKGRILKYGKC